MKLNGSGIGLAVTAVCALAVSAQAGLVNPGFEAGLSEWSPAYTSGGVAVTAEVPSFDGETIYHAPDGSHLFLELTSGDPQAWVTVSRTFSDLQVNDVVTVWAAFDIQDKLASPEARWTWDGSEKWYRNILSTDLKPDHTDWVSWTTTITAPGSHSLAFQLRQNYDGDPSRALFDVTVVPEPSTWMAGGILSLLAGLSRVARSRR